MKRILLAVIIALSFLTSWGTHVYAQEEENPLGGVDVGGGGDILGDINLAIFKPFGTLDGEATIFSTVAQIYYILSILTLIGFFFAVIWGSAKLAMSQWQQDKVNDAMAWIRNGFIGMIALFLVFGVVYLIAILLGLGQVFQLHQTLRQCGGQFGYEYLETSGEISGTLECSNDTWTVSIENVAPEDPETGGPF